MSLIAHNSYQASLGMTRPDSLQYRTEVQGKPTVADLLPSGTHIRTNYAPEDSAPYLVLCVVPYGFCGGCFSRFCDCARSAADMQPFDLGDRPQPGCFPVRSWSIVCFQTDSPGPPKPNRWVSEFVAVGDRILHVFPNNADEILIATPAAISHNFQLTLSL